MKESYDVDIYPSSDSEDNDSEDDEINTEALKQKFFYKEVMKRALD